MNTSNQPNENDAKQKKSALKAWRPLKLRILDIGQNTHDGTKSGTQELTYYAPPSS